ncbi:L-2-hydroxyglutarate oxidase [Microbacterium natoriense]|uniref:L-2-hydroxyglutarate oxidase n=1 Tax=Microbacterium natoriense TaxID=284570 RepID=A0AAW8EW57_9MICO|nr:L-2-hydroxyglutarate oxidase [Microbacterium natoriense]MDQ0647771.1 L-2-hydroxyglutarate oxidase [Microbacterium natoriense]
MAGNNVVIIGGGIIGLAVAERAARAGRGVVVLEKEEDWALHQTGRNSGVIHAGPYYKPGSLKAQMCVEGNASMRRFAVENGIPHEFTGKLIVATSEKEIANLKELERRATANGVPTRWLSAAKAHEFEPHVSCVAALRVETTGIIDYGAVSRRLAETAAERGAEMVLGAAARAIRSENGKIVVEHSKGVVRADVLVNCAGLQSDKVARMAGLRPAARIVPFRGEYFHLSKEKEHLVQGLIYPVPDPELPFLGVHLTKMTDGSRHAGPNAVTALGRESYSWAKMNIPEALGDITYPGFLRMASHNIPVGVAEVLRSFSRKRFADSLSRLVPGIEARDLTPSPAGIRAQAIARDGKLVDDFLFELGPQQVHVLNAPSPAATSALVIAEHISRKAGLLDS